MTCDTDGTYDFIPQCANLAKNFQQHPSWSAGWGGEQERQLIPQSFIENSKPRQLFLFWISNTTNTWAKWMDRQ